MKRLISVMLVICMTFSFYMPISATQSATIEFDISPNTYEYINGKITESKPSLGMSKTSYAVYSFTADMIGTYQIYATVAANENQNAEVSAYVDDNPVGKGTFTGIDWYEKTEVLIGTEFLKTGMHSLKIKNTGGVAFRLRGIKIRGIPASSEELEDLFLADMKAAQNSSDIQKVLKQYNSYLPVPYDDYLNELFYRRIIDEELTKLSYDSLEETNALFMTLYNEEKNNPLVTLTQNDESVTTLDNGEFTVTIAPRFMEELKAIAAIYTDDGMTLIDSRTVDIQPYRGATITGMTATDSGKLLKVFFIKDTETLRPVDLPLIQSRIYVDTEGNDDNDGTIDKPLKTIERAIAKTGELNAVHPRDIVICLGGGEYVIEDTIELDETFSGRDDCGVHFKSLTPDNPAVISGGYDVTGWNDNDNDGIYTAQLPENIADVRQLYINEYPAQRARSDKYYFAENRWDNTENNIDENGEETGYTEDGFDLFITSFPRLSKPGDAELVYPIKWSVHRLPVQDIEYEVGGRILVKMEQPYYSTGITMICDGGIQPTIGNRFYIENDRTLLDEEGEFYFDKDTNIIYYKPFEKENLLTARTVIGKTENLFLIKGSSSNSNIKNVTFSDIKFRYGGYYTEINREGAVSFQAENLVNAESGLGQNTISTGVGRTLDAQIVVENAEGIMFKNCNIACMGSTALRMGGGVSESVIKGCVFSDIGGSAISIGTWDYEKKLAEEILAENNVISRIGLDFMFCPGISIYYAKSIDIIHNTMAHTPYSGISVNWGWAGYYNSSGTNLSRPNRMGVGEHTISCNRIYDISNAVIDGGHIYNLAYMKDTLISDNYLSDSPDKGGIYFDTGSSNVTVTRNVITNCSVDAIFAGDGELNIGNKAFNNWSDHEQRKTKTWSGEGSSFEAPVVIQDPMQWPPEAQNVMNNAGVKNEYFKNLNVLNKPDWRTIEHFDYPSEEALEPGVVYVNAGDLHKYYIKPQDRPNEEKPNGKTEPKLFDFSNIVGVGDFRYGEWAQYEVTIPEAGDYSLVLQYSGGNIKKVNVYLDDEELGEKYDYFLDKDSQNVYYKDSQDVPGLVFYKQKLPVTDTASTGYIPYVFKDADEITSKVLSLDKGTYYLRMLNVGDSFGYSRFKFIPVSNNK